MLTIGSINARIGLDSSGYSRGILEAQAANSAFGANFAQFVGNPLLGGIGMLRQAGGWFVETSKRVLENAETIDRLSQRTGISTNTLQGLRAEMDLAHGAGDKVTKMFGEFGNKLGEARQGGGPMAETLKTLGIELEAVGDNERLLRLVLDRLSEIPDVAMRGALAAKIFGQEAGPLLVNAIGGGEQALDRLIQRQSDLGQVLETQTISRLATLNTTVGTLKQGFDGLAQSAVAAFLEGFADSSGKTDQNIVRLARTIKDEIVPAAREMSEIVLSITGATRDWNSETSDTIEGLMMVLRLMNDLREVGVAVATNFSGLGAAVRTSELWTHNSEMYSGRRSAAEIRALRLAEGDARQRDRFLEAADARLLRASGVR